MSFIKSAALTGVVALSAAVPATASSVVLDYQNPANGFSGANGTFSEAARYYVDTYTNPVNDQPLIKGTIDNSIGQFQLTSTDSSNTLRQIVGYCLEIGHSTFRANEDVTKKTYTIGTYLSQAVQDRLAKLAHLAWDKVDTAGKAAAFQMAVWEITHDNPNGALSLADGTFQVRYYDITDSSTWGTENWGAATKKTTYQLAQSWLDTIKDTSYTEMRQMTFLTSADRQDLWTDHPIPGPDPNPVPLPAGGVAMLSALGLLGAMRRRRKG